VRRGVEAMKYRRTSSTCTEINNDIVKKKKYDE